MRDIGDLTPKIAIVSSGTAESLARMASHRRGGQQPKNFNAFSFTANELNDAVRVIEAARSAADRRAIQGLDASRADIILGGAIVLQTIIEESDIETVVFSDYALREGLLLDTIRTSVPTAPRELRNASRSSVESLVSRLDENPTHSRHVAQLGLQMLDQLVDVLDVSDDRRLLLESAALLSNVGLSVSHSKHHLHSYYIIKNADLPGFREHDVELIAQIARYHRKSKPKMSHEPFANLDDADRHTVRALAAVLRIAIGLDRSYDARVDEVRVRRKGSKLTLEALSSEGSDLSLNLYSARERADLLADVTGCTVEIK